MPWGHSPLTTCQLLAMKSSIVPVLLLVGVLASTGCSKDTSTTPAPSCANEQVLASYQSREAVVTRTQLDTYCLVVDSTDLVTGSYQLDHYLVPAVALPAPFQTEGLRVLVTGRKKSCYGLTTLPQLRTMFGYKFEVEAIELKTKR